MDGRDRSRPATTQSCGRGQERLAQVNDDRRHRRWGLADPFESLRPEAEARREGERVERCDDANLLDAGGPKIRLESLDDQCRETPAREAGVDGQAVERS